MKVLKLAFDVEKIAREGDVISLISKGGIYTLNENSAVDGVVNKKTSFPQYGSRQYFVGNTKTFLLTGNDLFISEKGKYEFSLIYDTAGDLLAGDGDSTVVVNRNLDAVFVENGVFYSDKFKHPISSNGNRFGVLLGRHLYVVNQWGASNAYIADKTAENPSDVVLKLDLVTGIFEDITYNLPCKNRLGNKYGSAGDIVFYDNHLMVSTEEGVFKFNGDYWESILDNWGASKLFTLENGELLAVTSAAGYEVFNILRNGEWLVVGRVSTVKGLTIRDVVLLGNSIYINRGTNELIVISLDDIQIPTYNKPKSVVDTGLIGVTTACKYGDDLFLAADKVVIKIKDGNQQVIAQPNANIKDIVATDNDVFVATESHIFSVLKPTKPFDIKSKEIKLKTSGDTLFCLVDKHLIVLDKSLSVVTLGKCQGDYVTDFVYNPANGLFYVVGFQDRKYNNIPVQVAFLHQYKVDGLEIKKLEGKVWDFDPKLLGKNLSDTRALNIELLDDNHVVVVGEQAGGDGIFRFNGQDLATQTSIVTDIYDDPSTGKTRSAHILWYGIVNTQTNLVESGRYAIPRNPEKQYESSANRARTLHMDGRNIFIGSLAGYKIRRRDGLFNGVDIPKYDDGDASFIRTNADDLSSRDWFTSGHGEPMLYTGDYAVVTEDGKVDVTIISW